MSAEEQEKRDCYPNQSKATVTGHLKTKHRKCHSYYSSSYKTPLHLHHTTQTPPVRRGEKRRFDRDEIRRKDDEEKKTGEKKKRLKEEKRRSSFETKATCVNAR